MIFRSWSPFSVSCKTLLSLNRFDKLLKRLLYSFQIYNIVTHTEVKSDHIAQYGVDEVLQTFMADIQKLEKVLYKYYFCCKQACFVEIILRKAEPVYIYCVKLYHLHYYVCKGCSVHQIDTLSCEVVNTFCSNNETVSPVLVHINTLHGCQCFQGTLAVGSADNLASQLLGGFKNLSGALRKCQYYNACMTTFETMQTKVRVDLILCRIITCTSSLLVLQFVTEEFKPRTRVTYTKHCKSLMFIVYCL